jgi:hypothetical protein
MGTNITQMLFRRGSNQSRQSTILGAGEPGFTTDSKRTYVGDGTQPGGFITGNYNYGLFDYIPGSFVYNGVNTGLSTAAFFALTGAEIGDIAYDSNSNILYSINTAPNGFPLFDYLEPIARNVTLNPTEFFFSQNSQINLQNQAVSGIHISPVALDNQTLTLTTSAGRPVVGVAVGGGLAPNGKPTGISNTNFAYAPANSLKGNFTNQYGPVTDVMAATGKNVYQIVGTASNTTLGIYALSAGANMSFATVTGVNVNSEINETAIVLNSTPNLEAGDGIVLNIDPNTFKNTYSVYNSIDYIRPHAFTINSYASRQTLVSPDGTNLNYNTICFPWNSSNNTSSIPAAAFETPTLVGFNPPTATIFWTITSQKGSGNVTIFALASSYGGTGVVEAQRYNTPVSRGSLYPSYWQQYTYYTTEYATAYAYYRYSIDRGGGDRAGVASYAYTYSYQQPHQAWEDWPANINCALIEGSSLFIGGNFQNIGNTVDYNNGNFRYGFAVINMLYGNQAGYNDYVGALSAVATGSTPPNQVVNQPLFTTTNFGSTPGAKILNSYNPLSDGFNQNFNQSTPGWYVNQIARYKNSAGNNYLCIGGNWGPQLTRGSNSVYAQPSTSFALFDATNGYDITPYTFEASNNNTTCPATIFSLTSAGSFLYVGGNFFQARLTSDSISIQSPGIARIKLDVTNTGDPIIDNLPIGSIDPVFARNIYNSLYGTNDGSYTPSTPWNYPVYCLKVVPDPTNQPGAAVLYAGGDHYVPALNASNANARKYDHLTTHYVGMTAINGVSPDGNLTNFNCIFNGTVNDIISDSQGLVYTVGNFTTFTSARLDSQTINAKCTYVLAFDTLGGYSINGSAASTTFTQVVSGDTDKVNNIYGNSGNNKTSPRAPFHLQSWRPACNGPVYGIELQETNPTNGNPPAVILAGAFTRVGDYPCSYLTAVTYPVAVDPAAPTDAFLMYGFEPLQWFPQPNTPLTNRGGKGCNILRIPYTSPLSGIFVCNGAAFNTVGGQYRQSMARISGVNESTSTSLSAINWSVTSGVIGQNGSLALDTTRVTTLCDNVPNLPYTIRGTELYASALQPAANASRGDLCRYYIYRPGASVVSFSNKTSLSSYNITIPSVNPDGSFNFLYDGNVTPNGKPSQSAQTSLQNVPDTFADNVYVLGVKLDFDTGTAINNYHLQNVEPHKQPPVVYGS